MMSNTDTLKLALEALESCDQVYGSGSSYQYFSQVTVDKAITAIKQALLTATPLAAPVQEPVAIVRQKTDAYGGTFIQQYKMLEPNTKLYTTPPAPVLPHCEHDFKMSPSYGGYLCAVCGKPERRK
jgi:adenine/guanine phosphoribosyltransferase-like PRPP-binding protein